MTTIQDEIDKSNERFRSLFLGIPIPSYIWKKIDNKFIFTDYNPAAEEISKGKVKKRLEIRASDLYKDQPDILKDLNRCYDEKTSFSRELRHEMNKSGEKKDLLVRYNYISPDMVLVHVEDITKRKQLEVQIKQSEVRYHALFEYNISACAFQEVVYDSKGNPINYRFNDVNSMFEKILSVNRDNVIGKLATNVYKTETPLNLDIYSIVAETMVPTSFTYYFEPMNKYFKTSVFTFEKGKFITVFEDISDQIGAELREIESEKKFRSIIESTSDAIVLAGLEANYLYSSPQYSNMIGGIDINYNSDLFSVFHPDDIEWFKKIYFKAVKEKGVPKDGLNKPFEMRLLRNDGRFIWISCSSKDYFNDDGKLIGFINTIRDITERKETEQALKESEENLRKLNEELENRVRVRTQELVQSEGKYKDIIERNYDGYFETDLRGVFTFVSKRVCDSLEYSEEELLGMDSFKVMNLIDINRVRAKYNELYSKDLPQIIIEHDIITKHGKVTPIEVACYLKYDSKRNKIGFYALSRDINVRKLLKESEEKFRVISEQSLMGIAIIQEGIFKYVNKKASEIVEYSVEEMLGFGFEGFVELIHPEDLEFTLEQARKKQLGDDNVIANYQYRIKAKSREIKWVDNYSVSIEYGGKTADLVNIIDITDRKLAEQKLIESEEKYREAYNLAEIYKDIFAHDISNILQNILSSVEINLFFLKGSEFTNESEKNLGLIKDQVKNGALLISNVRKLSQIELKPYKLENINVRNVLKQAVDIICEKFEDKNVNIQILDSNKNIHIHANEFLIDVFENLLFNGIKHNENSSIDIHVKPSEIQLKGKKYLQIEFLDNGIGVEDIRKKEIFQREVKEDKSVSGIGFGLLLIKKIIDGYNGKIWVEDKVAGDYKKGSNFILLIPKF